MISNFSLTSNNQGETPFAIYSNAVATEDVFLNMRSVSPTDWQLSVSGGYFVTVERAWLQSGAVEIYNQNEQLISKINFPASNYVINDAPAAALFPLDTFGLFKSSSEILQKIQLSLDYDGNNLPLIAWRWLRDNTSHSSEALTYNEFYNIPYLYLNSAGGGLCGNRAAIFMNIMEAAGYDARIWTIDGHTVSEVQVNGSWQIYDVDLDAIYLDQLGNIASYEYLAANPNDPYLTRIQASEYINYWESSTFLKTYNTAISVLPMYASTNDNKIYNLTPNLTPFIGDARLPEHSWAQIFDEYKSNHRFFDVGGNPFNSDYLVVNFDEINNFVFNYPLLLADITGEGSIMIGNTSYVIGSSQLNSYIDQQKGNIPSFAITTTGANNKVAFLLSESLLGIQDYTHIWSNVNGSLVLG